MTRRRRCKPFDVSDSHRCKVYKTGNITDIVVMKKPRNNLSKIKRLPGNQYVNLETGELHSYKASPPRSNNGQSLSKSFCDLRRIINNNFTGDDTELHIVLTYRDDVSGTDGYYMAEKDFKNFWSKFHRSHPSVEYIRVIEPQQTGRWHIHCLVKDISGTRLHVEQDWLCNCWGHGRVYADRLPFSDNFGAYFSARFSDINLFEDTSLTEQYPNAKQIVKGGRLRYYPPKYRLYTCSRGIQKPTPVSMTYGKAKKAIENDILCHSRAYRILLGNENDDEREVNQILYEQYKKNRKEK